MSDEDTGVLINQFTIFFKLRPSSRIRSLALTLSPVLKSSLFLKIRKKKKKNFSRSCVQVFSAKPSVLKMCAEGPEAKYL